MSIPSLPGLFPPDPRGVLDEWERLTVPRAAHGAESLAMGASSWDYVVPYQDDITRAFAELQQRVFDEGDYYRDDYDDFLDVTSLEALLAGKESERFWEVGTHSILDMDQIIDAGRPDEAGAIRALSGEELRTHLGSDHPTRADWERAFNVPTQPGTSAPINAGFPRWSGRYAVLYRDGAPHEIAFWGWSGD
jgi:hypothetical protein